MKVFKGQPIRRQIVVAATLLLLPIVAAVIWSSARAVREQETALKDQAASIATTSAAYLNQYLDGLDSLASALVRHPTVQSMRPRESDRLFADVLAEQKLLLNIVLAAPDGAIRGSAIPARYAIDGPRLPFLAQVVANDKPVISELTVGQVSHKPTVILAYPVHGEAGDVVGILGMGLDLQSLQTMFAGIPLPEGSVITLADRSSRVLARSLEPERYIGTTISARPLDPSRIPETVVMTGMDGVTRIFGNAPVERGPWNLSVGIPQSVAAARVQQSLGRNLIIGGTGAFSAFLLALFLARHLTRQLAYFRSAAQRISAGDLTPPERTRVGNLELSELQDAFITMATNLREVRNALDHQVEEERKMREMLQSLQRQVVRQERLTAVGLLVSGVAHELNNPLQAILGTAELLERDKHARPEVLDEIAFIKTQAGRAREIIRNLSRFSSQQSGPPALVDLRDVIAEVIQLRQRDADASAIALDVEAATTRQVYANFTELEQVTLNFVINAQQAIEASGRPRGRIVIRLYDVGRKVRLEVLDNGLGVRPEDEPKLFQPFFTTKPVGKGTGLGLSVSYGIIDSYGGTIGYRANEWGGATFFFELPAGVEARSPGEHDRAAVLHRSVPPGV